MYGSISVAFSRAFVKQKKWFCPSAAFCIKPGTACAKTPAFGVLCAYVAENGVAVNSNTAYVYRRAAYEYILDSRNRDVVS